MPFTVIVYGSSGDFKSKIRAKIPVTEQGAMSAVYMAMAHRAGTSKPGNPLDPRRVLAARHYRKPKGKRVK